MLAFFQVNSQFYQTCVKIYVDVFSKQFSYTITFDGVIEQSNLKPIMHFEEIRTPELAEKWIEARIEGIHRTLVRNQMSIITL